MAVRLDMTVAVVPFEQEEQDRVVFSNTVVGVDEGVSVTVTFP